MDPAVKKYLNDINQLSQQLESSIYLVGGTIRDHLLKRPCKDYDFTSAQAPEIARQWAHKVQRTLVPLDETPGHETYRVVLHPNLYFDFTTLQGQDD
jgi:tRNA nucleotidyltransferase/poly(A) polymerase